MLMPCKSPLFDKLANFGDRLKRSDLVVCVHYRNQNGLVVDCFAEILNPHDSFVIDGKIGYPKASLFQVLTGCQYSRMLDLRRDDVIAVSSMSLCYADDGKVVSLGAARDEGYLGWLCIDQTGNLASRVLYRLPGTLSPLVGARGISEDIGEEGPHGPDNFIVNSRRGAIIEIDALEIGRASCRERMW